MAAGPAARHRRAHHPTKEPHVPPAIAIRLSALPLIVVLALMIYTIRFAIATSRQGALPARTVRSYGA
jgi:hypothetical protein